MTDLRTWEPRVGDRVLIRRTADAGREYVGEITAVWQGEPFPWPYLVRWRDGYWRDFVSAWASASELAHLSADDPRESGRAN